MIHRIDLVEEYSKKKIEDIQREHRDKVEGIYELYDNLYVVGYTESYSESRIHYVAYTLSSNNIDFKVTKG